MSDKPVYIAATLGAGVMLGIPLGAIAAANILPVTVGEGWANIGGAAIGVLGAFAIANWSANRNLRTMQAEKLKPAHRAAMFALERIEIAIHTSKAVHESIIPVYAQLSKLMGDQKAWDKYTGFDIFQVNKATPKGRQIANIALNIDNELFEVIAGDLNLAERELSWVRDTMKGIVSPSEIQMVEEVIKLISTARYNTDLAKTTVIECINLASMFPPRVSVLQVDEHLGKYNSNIPEKLSKAIATLSPLTKLI